MSSTDASRGTWKPVFDDETMYAPKPTSGAVIATLPTGLRLSEPSSWMILAAGAYGPPTLVSTDVAIERSMRRQSNLSSSAAASVSSDAETVELAPRSDERPASSSLALTLALAVTLVAEKSTSPRWSGAVPAPVRCASGAASCAEAPATTRCVMIGGPTSPARPRWTAMSCAVVPMMSSKTLLTVSLSACVAQRIVVVSCTSVELSSSFATRLTCLRKARASAAIAVDDAITSTRDKSIASVDAMCTSSCTRRVALKASALACSSCTTSTSYVGGGAGGGAAGVELVAFVPLALGAAASVAAAAASAAAACARSAASGGKRSSTLSRTAEIGAYESASEMPICSAVVCSASRSAPLGIPSSIVVASVAEAVAVW